MSVAWLNSTSSHNELWGSNHLGSNGQDLVDRRKIHSSFIFFNIWFVLTLGKLNWCTVTSTWGFLNVLALHPLGANSHKEVWAVSELPPKETCDKVDRTWWIGLSSLGFSHFSLYYITFVSLLINKFPKESSSFMSAVRDCIVESSLPFFISTILFNLWKFHAMPSHDFRLLKTINNY